MHCNVLLTPYAVPILIAALFLSQSIAQGERVAGSSVRFTKKVLTDKYFCDGVTAGDINGDQRLDIVAGPFWFEGPEFKRRHAFYKPVLLPPAKSPSNSMFSFVWDFNGDGRLDVLVLGRVHKHPAIWYENPGPVTELWKRHFVFERVRGESPTLVDLNGDGQPQLVCHWDGRWGWIAPRPGHPYETWDFHAISEDRDWPQFYHGEGVGDVNGDGRLDLLINDGWFQQPSHEQDKWSFFETRFSRQRGGAQMFAYDVNADGLMDVISSKHAHAWGLAWYEQRLVEGTRESGVRFREHTIMGTRDELAEYGIAFSQPHALALADVNGDGLMDIVTGKRRWAHGPNGDVEPNADPVVAWFELQREGDGARFRPHSIDASSGVGTQIFAGDVNGDGRTDVLTASKLGVFAFLQKP